MTSILKRLPLLAGLLLMGRSSFAQGSVANYALTHNIYAPIAGKYPDGFAPKWRLVGAPQSLTVNGEQYITKFNGTFTKAIQFGLTDYQGKSVVDFHVGCNCVADIDMNTEKVVLTETPVKLPLKNFRKKQVRQMDDPNEPCQMMAAQTRGGWKGYVELSSDQEGNLTMSLRLENYAAPTYRNGALMYVYYVNNSPIPNMMTPTNAVTTSVRQDNEAKDRQKQADEYAQKQEQRRRLDAAFETSYKSVKARPAAQPKTILTYKEYNLKKTISLDNLVGGSISNSTGVAEAYKSARTGYLALIGGFDYEYKAEGLEPYERNEKFALKYSMVKAVNSIALKIATYAMIGDVDKLNEMGELLGRVRSTDDFVDGKEQRAIVGDLKSK